MIGVTWLLASLRGGGQSSDPDTAEFVPVIVPPRDPDWQWPTRGHKVRPTTLEDGTKRQPHGRKLVRGQWV